VKFYVKADVKKNTGKTLWFLGAIIARKLVGLRSAE